VNTEPDAGGGSGSSLGAWELSSISMIPPNTEVWAAFRTRGHAPELPELRGRAFIDRDVGKYHVDAQSEIRVRLHEVAPREVIGALRSGKVRLGRYFLRPRFLSAFWDAPPEDCAGALLAPDGHVSLRDASLYWRVVPLTEPLYTRGRPESDGEHSRHKPHVLHAGGIPIVSDELLAALRQLGAEGETGEVTYRGFNKAASDTVQAGFRRFLPRPEYAMRYTGGFEFLPEGVPGDFRVCAMLRSRTASPGQGPDIPPHLAEDRWYEIALALGPGQALRRSRSRILLTPIFRINGATHRWVSELETALEVLRA
jgi:hypothetical protein